MESQKRDESRDRRREEALARRMGEALDRLSPSDAGECPDAELIAAYREGALQPDEIAQWEGHFAACARCRKILLVLAASVDAPLAEKEVAHLGQLVASAHAPREAASRIIGPAHSNRLGWRGRWLAPALGVAAVLAVWFAMRPPWRTSDQNPSGTLIAQAPKSEPPQDTERRALDQFSRAASKKNPETDAVIPKERSVFRNQSPNPAAESRAKNRLEDGNAVGAVAPSAGVVGGFIANERKDESELKSAPAAAPPPSPRPLTLPPPAAPRQTEAQVAEQAPPAKGAPSAAAQTVVVTGGAAEVTTAPSAKSSATAGDKQKVAEQAAADSESGARAAANLPLAGRDFKALSKLDATIENSALTRTPSGSTLWRAGKGGSIQRSTDTGRTWILQASPLQEDWLAGAAVSDTICWIVGRNGAIARTTDGEHWEKIAPPPLAAGSSGKLADWVGVTARDAQAATITASDQHRYVTRDGGKNWRAQ